MFGRIAVSVLAAALLPLVSPAQSTIKTVAGGGPNKLPAVAASLNFPSGIARDSSGNLYVSVQQDDRVYKIDPTGQLTVLAGNGVFGNSGDGGPATQSELASPAGLAVDSSGNVFIADFGQAGIREVVASSGNIQTVAGNGTGGFSGDGGLATNAQLDFPTDVAVDSSGNLFIADSGNGVIRKVSAADGTIQTVAGNGTFGFSGDGGPATSASFQNLEGVSVDGSGNLFITDIGAAVVRKVTVATGIITTVAGNGTQGFSGDGGPATSASLSSPFKAVIDSSGNLFITDGLNANIREVLAATGVIQTVAGTGTQGFSGNGGPATSAELQEPIGIAVDGNGNFYFADLRNLVVQEVVAATGNIQVVAGNGFATFSGDGQQATSAELGFPNGFFVDASGNLFIADNNNSVIRKVSAADGTIQTIAGTGTSGFSGDGGLATNATLGFPVGVVLDASGNVFIADAGDEVIREVVAATGNIQTVAGNGTAGFTGDGGLAIMAELNFPEDIKVDTAGNLFFTDSGNNAIREVVAATGNIQTIAGTGTTGSSGDGGPATSAELNNPNGLFIDPAGNIFFADSDNNAVREIVAATGNIQTVAGNGTAGFTGDGGLATAAELNLPFAVFVDVNGNLFLTDSGNNVIREVVAATGNIQTVAGNGVADFSGDGGPVLSAAIGNPLYLAPGTSGSYYVTDLSNRIRVATPNGTAAGPSAQLSENNLTFSANAGSSSAAQTVTLTNTGTATLNITSIAITGANSGNFSQTNTCGASVAAAANCTISVTYKPATAGNSSASVAITDNANGSPQSVTLSGTASAGPATQLSLNNLTFSANAGTSSAAQTVTLTNTGTATLNITSIAITGTNSGDFSQTNTCGASVAAGANCTISVTYKPATAGNSSASVAITDNANGSPQGVTLSGTAADFSLALANGGANSATVQAGGTATYNLQLNPTNSYTGSVTLACSGAPSAATCSVSPGTLTLNGNNVAAPLAVSVTTTARRGAALPLLIRWRRIPGVPLPIATMATLAVALALIMVMTIRRSRSAWIWAPGAALVLCMNLLSGCGGGNPSTSNPSGTPAGAYTITVTATPQLGTSHIMTLQLNVQ